MSRYYPLINRMITRFSLKDKLANVALSSETPFSKPFITIAREPGSGGAPIARAVAKKLGFTFVDKQIIEEIAGSTKKRRDIIKQVDERSRSKISDMVHSLLNKEYVDDIKYMAELTKIILAYANRGHVVILGRGANFITPKARGLHVRITAPYEVRVKRAMEYEGFDRKTATKIIEEVEDERRKFVKQYLWKDTSKQNAYDLTINTTYFTVKQARDIVIEAFCGKFPRADRYISLIKDRLPHSP